MGKGGKGDYWWLQGDVVFESCFVAACTGMMYLFVVHVEIKDEDEMLCKS